MRFAQTKTESTFRSLAVAPLPTSGSFAVRSVCLTSSESLLRRCFRQSKRPYLVLSCLFLQNRISYRIIKISLMLSCYLLRITAQLSTCEITHDLSQTVSQVVMSFSVGPSRYIPTKSGHVLCDFDMLKNK